MTIRDIVENLAGAANCRYLYNRPCFCTDISGVKEIIFVWQMTNFRNRLLFYDKVIRKNISTIPQVKTECVNAPR